MRTQAEAKKTNHDDETLLDAAFERVWSADDLLNSVSEDASWRDEMKKNLDRQFSRVNDFVFVIDWVNAILQKYKENKMRKSEAYREKQIRELAVYRSQAEACQAYKSKYRVVKSKQVGLEEALVTSQREASRLSAGNKTLSTERDELINKQKEDSQEARRLEDRLLQLSSENKNLVKKAGCVDSLNKQIEKLNARCTKLIAEKKSIVNQNQQLKQKLKQKESQSDVVKAGLEIKRLKRELEKKNATIVSLKANILNVSETLEAFQEEGTAALIEKEEQVRQLQIECDRYKGMIEAKSPNSVAINMNTVKKKTRKNGNAAKTSSHQYRSSKVDSYTLKMQFENKLDFFRRNNVKLRKKNTALEDKLASFM